MPLTITSAPRQLSDGNTAGTVLGRGATDLISFYNATPIVQPSGNAEAAITRGQACGTIATFTSAQSAPTTIATITTTEQAFTLFSGTGGAFLLAAGDVVYLNKPTSQAGLGVGNTRYSASNSLGITFSNFTAATLTPTAAELYSGVILRGFNSLSPVLTPVSVAAHTVREQQFPVTGLRVGELVQVVKPTAQAGLDIMGARVVSNNLLGISFGNVTAAAITPTAAETYTVMCLGGLDAVNNEMIAQINPGNQQLTVATITTAEQAFYATGIATTDTIKGVAKAPYTGAGIAGYRASAANVIGVAFVNPTAATVTPTTSIVMQVSFARPNPAAPLVLYTPALVPVSVAANTTAEQTFTVTGLIAGTPVWVNKPSAQVGLGICGVRVSATNTLAINYGNATGAAITPAAEMYTVGNFQVPYNVTDNTTSGACTMLQTACGVSQQQSILSNAHRSALVSLGLEAGA
ncbi:MAG: hypothetical protein EPO08_03435 [Rhodospirillaceae bacterium]|nr:MAG: hypothetical protein EPO08_03435 [Rhodospirillaceae bacterium]